jgi:hypothetical protein
MYEGYRVTATAIYFTAIVEHDVVFWGRGSAVGACEAKWWLRCGYLFQDPYKAVVKKLRLE